MQRQYDIVFDNFLDINLSQLALTESCFQMAHIPLIVVTYNPVDYPNKYVARLWDINRPTRNVMIKDSLEEIRDAISITFHRFPPTEDDDPIIVETYV